jgi:histidinol dehydrogenase
MQRVQMLNTKIIDMPEIFNTIRRQRSKAESVDCIVKPILEDVRENGDEAVMRYTRKFDAPQLDSVIVSEEERREALQSLDQDLIASLQGAKKNIETFHKTHISRKEDEVETAKGTKVWREFRPIEKIGLYVPGGLATYPSTVLMVAVPAILAGCKEIVICTPVEEDGKCNPAVLAAAEICNITKIYKVGGAQAIGAMAYGTETIPKVYKIFGPGNQFVTAAKILVYGDVDIDMPAGPSEIAIIADETANPVFIAADFLSQLEHAEDSQSILLTRSESLAKKVAEEVQKQMEKLSRKEIIEVSLKKSFIILCQNDEEMCEIANEYAPEHLEIMAEKEEFFLSNVNNVGSVFLGNYASEPLGDYGTGANHTLPTSGFAKMFSPLSTESFGKMIQVQRVSKEGAEVLFPIIKNIADSEGLDGHREAVAVRLRSQK